jgi:hypothetical protein
MNEHILSIFIEKINRVRRVRFSPYDSGSVKILRTILILWLYACVSFRAFNYRMDIVRATKGTQVQVQWNGEWYSTSSVYFLNKNV